MKLIPSPTLARYTATMLLLRTAAFALGLTLILQTLDMLTAADEILAVEGNTGADLLRYLSLRLPQLFSQFLPFSVLLAGLLTLGTLNQNSEIIVMKASGISAHQVLIPLILAGGLLSISHFAFNELVLTRANAELDRWQAEQYGAVELEDESEDGVWIAEGFDIVHAGRVIMTSDGVLVRDLDIYQRPEAQSLRAEIRADEARFIDGSWVLTDVELFDVSSGSSRRVERFIWETGIAPEQFEVSAVDSAALPFWELKPAIAMLKRNNHSTDALEAELMHKFSGPLSSLLMPLLAAVAGFGLARSGHLFLRLVAGMALGFGFFVVDSLAMALGQVGALPPLMAAWGPFFLFFFVGESIVFRTEE